jgi:hypothetical protein
MRNPDPEMDVRGVQLLHIVLIDEKPCIVPPLYVDNLKLKLFYI